MTLIVGMDRDVTKEQALTIKEQFKERGIDAIIITGVTSLAVVNP
jgi:hypothetical protein